MPLRVPPSFFAFLTKKVLKKRKKSKKIYEKLLLISETWCIIYLKVVQSGVKCFKVVAQKPFCQGKEG